MIQAASFFYAFRRHAREAYWRWKFPEVIQYEINQLDFSDWWKREESETACEMAGFYKQYKDFLALV